MQVDHDVIVIGAGFAGLRSVHKLRDELGLDVLGLERGNGPGGTWYWNRYPGARCDIESVHYSYSFDADLQREWEWSERYAGQPEILAYLEHVADRFDLRRSFRFDTTVTAVALDDDGAWTVSTDDGARLRCRFVVSAAGNLSEPSPPRIDGIGTFTGQVVHTSSWPAEGVDLDGKRVVVIGTGSTGIQVIPEVARRAGHLTVLQRTPNYVAPLGNEPVDPERRRWLAENHEEVRAGADDSFLGTGYPPAEGPAMAATPERRRELYDRYWGAGGFRLLLSTFSDLLVDPEANETLAEYIRERIRETVEDPRTAELLCPDDHPYGTKRAPFGTDYYETFNRDDVTLVSLRETPIERISGGVLHTTDAEIPVDVLILATGFDAVTGPLFRLDITGREGLRLQDAWEDGPSTYLGLGMHGFPNLFTITGAQSHVALYNNPPGIEQHIEFVGDAIRHVIDGGHTTIEVTEEAQRRWRHTVETMLHLTLLPQATSWYMGDNIPGKPRAAFLFPGGGVVYRAILAEIIDHGMSGLSVDGAPSPLPPILRMDPAALSLMSIMSIEGAKPLELCTPEEVRAGLEGFCRLQLPAADAVTVDTHYPSAAGDDMPVRIFRPDERTADAPVVIWYHGGGWMGGSIDVVDERCRAIAHDHGAVVVAPSYRLAPEHPFPAAPDDAWAALRWTADVIADHGGDPGRIFVAGDSAGGNLAAVVAQRSRDEGGPHVAGQVLVYPATGRVPDSASLRDYANGPILTVGAIGMFLDAYLPPGTDQTDPAFSPACAESLAGLPPALILTAECDPLRDEGEAYAVALRDAGVPVQAHRIAGLIHGGFSMSAVFAGAQEMHAAIGEFVARSARPVAVPAD
ncbi:MAG: alpha/beta hydrolase fold domain-containing protein [Solirubrobacteraceae bacterium]